MTQRNPLIYAVAILFLGFSAIAAYQAYKFIGLIILLFVTGLFILVTLLYYRSRFELIDEMEVGVIFNRFNNNFCRFEVSQEPTPGDNCRDYRISHWIPFPLQWLKFNDPYHVRLRWYEELTGKISKKSLSTSGKLENIRTSDGVPITIPWKVSYTIDVSLIPEKLRHKMARALPEHSSKVVTSRVERAIKCLVEQKNIASLHAEGSVCTLEEEVAQKIYEQLSIPVNLGFKEIPAKDVILGPISMPPKVEKALEIAYQRKIQTEMMAEALERLQKAVNGFSKEDMHRLAELERLRILDDKEVRALYLSDAFIRSESMKMKKDLNGRSHQKN